MSARGTAIEMPAQGGGSAVGDGAEHTQVLRRQPGAMGLDEACPVLANDVGHLEGWPRHDCGPSDLGVCAGTES